MPRAPEPPRPQRRPLPRLQAGLLRSGFYAKGRDITVVGRTQRQRAHKVAEYDYTFAKVDADEVYMSQARRHPAGYYDPFWGPCYGDPFWVRLGPAGAALRRLRLGRWLLESAGRDRASGTAGRKSASEIS